MRKVSIAAAAATLALAGSAQAFEAYTDYTPSKEVWNVTMVKVNPNRIDDYLEGLKQTWVPGCEIGKKNGVVVDCFIYLSETSANRDFNMMLVMKLPSGATWTRMRTCSRRSRPRPAPNSRRTSRTSSSRATKSFALSGAK